MSDGSRQPSPNPFAQSVARNFSLRCVSDSLDWSATSGDGRRTIHWPCRVARLLPGLSVLESPLVRRYDTDGGPDVSGAAADDLLEHLLKVENLPAGSPHVLVVRNLVAEGPVWDALNRLDGEGAITLRPIVAWRRATLDRSAAPDADAYLGQAVSHARLKQLRQKRRALERLGPLSLDVALTPDAVQRALESFSRLEAAGWKGRAGTALAQDAEGMAYVRGLMAVLAQEGLAFALALSHAERVVASSLFVRAGGVVVFWKTTYDEGLAKFSPGVVLDLMATEWLYAQPWFETMDAGHDDSVDPARVVWAERRSMATVVIDLKPGSWRGRVVVGLLGLRQRLRRWKNHR
jgi:hypothetical protein